MTASTPHPFSFRLPAAFLRFWTDEPEGVGLAGAEVFRLSRSQRGFHLVAPGTLAITALSGDAAIFDTALHVGRLLGGLAAKSDESIRLLVLPGEIQMDAGNPRAAMDRLIEQAPSIFPALEPGVVHVTGWVSRMLELAHITREVTIDRDPSDPQPPLLRIGRRQPEASPWRNSEILNRRLRAVDRPELMAAGRDLLAEPVWRIEGPLGCGKSYFAHQLLLESKIPRLWLRGEPQHRSAGGLAQQIVDQISATAVHDLFSPLSPGNTDRESGDWPPRLSDDGGIEELSGLLSALVASAEHTFFLVVDDLEHCSQNDLQMLFQLTSLQEVGRSIRVLLIGRSGTAIPEALQKLPTLEIGPFSDREMGQFSPQLFTGLSLPTPTQDRLHQATQGCPFALEEAMIALIRERSLRRVYGSFFFAGQDATDFSPSPRLLTHLQAESFRLGLEIPVHLLSLVDSGIPAEILGEAALSLGHETPEEWHVTATAARFLVKSETPWGPGVDFNCPVFGTTLATGLDPESIQDLRVALGDTLAAASSSGKSLWEAHRLLRGTGAATEPLLKALETPFATRIPRAVMLEALTQELYRHREREGDEETELQLLWRLLPLARKLGQLNEFTTDLERGVELATGQPRRLLALAGLKAEMDQDAGRYEEAEVTIKTALEAAKGADDRRQALLLIQLGRLQLEQERYSEAQKLFLKLARQLDRDGVEALAASCRYYLGNLALREQRYEEALELHETALAQRRQKNLNRVAGNSLTAMGAVYLALGNYPRALACYKEAMDLLEKHGSDIDRAYPLLGSGRTLNRLGEYATASRSLREALKLREGKDDIAGEAIARLAVSENHLFLGQLDRAQEEATKALFQLNVLAKQTLLAEAEQLLGRIQIRLRQHDSARRHLETALDLHLKKANQRSVAFDLAFLVNLALIEENVQEARRRTADLEEAANLLARPDLEEQLHYQLYQSWKWLSHKGETVPDPVPHLESAYREVFRKASHLDPELRHQFLFQITEYREILEEGARLGLEAEAGP